ncbi:CPBP family intramembrane glutamic endopeptidase, partial [Corynebacterium durum]|uniref:CPBP family intramembrane glutamic endopeptidase n=1 Tax=Corynebacterium durum TaxID=61592 RepID=UPI0028806B53
LDQKLLPRMQARTAIICSTLISSVLFALMHGVPMAMITAFFFGTCAAALIRWHQSLWASVALHIANNTVVSLVLLFIYFTGTNVLG